MFGDIDLINRKWYRKVYISIIKRAKLRGLDRNNLKLSIGYCEIHHIIPKCMGGKDIDSNKCALTYKEHFICHKILCRLFPNNYWLHSSFYLMSHITIDSDGKKVKKKVSLKEVLEFREFSKINKKPKPKKERRKKPPKEKIKISKEEAQRKRTEGIKNYYKRLGPRPQEVRDKISKSSKGRKISEESIKKANETKTKNGSFKVSEETREKHRLSSLGKSHITEKAKIEMSNKYGFKVKYVNENGEIIVFDSMTKAASFIGKSIKYIKSNASKNLNGLSFIGNTNMIQRKIVDLDGRIYNSLSECARLLNISRSTLLDWINNKPEKGFRYL